jgi:hypothetical protein
MSRTKIILFVVSWGILAALGGIGTYRAYLKYQHDKVMNREMDQATAPIREFLKICLDDAANYCGETSIAQAPNCLKRQIDKLSPPCRELMLRR